MWSKLTSWIELFVSLNWVEFELKNKGSWTKSQIFQQKILMSRTELDSFPDLLLNILS